MSTIGQIVVDGRVYPSQATSPCAAAYPPNQSPSPGQMRPPQQQSPISPLLQQPSPSGYGTNQSSQPQQQQVKWFYCHFYLVQFNIIFYYYPTQLVSKLYFSEVIILASKLLCGVMVNFAILMVM